MHITIMILYGLTVWISAIAYTAIAGTWPVGYVVVAGPVIISGAVAFLALADYALCSVITAFRNRRKARRLDENRRQA